jgi:hypothetical protein
MNAEDTRELLRDSQQYETTYLGVRTSILGKDHHIDIDDSDRLMHTAVIGPTGQGKTNLLLWIARQDSYKTGLTFLNPKGGVIDRLISKLPNKRLNDIVYINPNRDRVPGINPLKPEISSEMTRAERDHQQRIVISSVMGLFRRLTNEWGERWPRNLRSLLSAHVYLNVHHGEENTLMDVYRCVTDPSRLQSLINRVPDHVTAEQLRELKGLSRREQEPLKRRLSDIVENQTVRSIVSPQENEVSFREALAERKIILVDAQAGQIGEWAASVIGSVVLTQLWSATAARSSLPAEDCPPHHILIDEVQEYVSEADHLRKMLSQCREFDVSITAATQYLDDLDTSMERAILNNTLTKVVFTPGASEDLSTFSTIMNGYSRDDLSRLGQYRPAIQRPAEQTMPPAKVADTYPPWSWDADRVEQRKERLLEQYDVLEDPVDGIPVELGQAGNAGGQHHRELLEQAATKLQERGIEVTLRDQRGGDDKPDGEVVLPDGTTGHLEAEHSTLSKPAKALTNLKRAVDEDRETIFVVENGNAEKLERIVSDPVNRHGSDHEDEQGSYSYYTDSTGEPFTEIEALENADYRIIEIGKESLNVHNDPVEAECPQLDQYSERELQSSCLYRIEDDYCAALGQPCVLTPEE